MAIALDTSSKSAASIPGTASSPVTWSHTCTGSNLYLIVGVYGADQTTVTVTYNSVSMTQINHAGLAANNNQTWIFALANPATGAHNVSITFSGGSGTASLWGAAVSLTGVNQTGQPEANNTNTGTSAASITASTTTVTNNAWIISMGCLNMAGGSISAIAGSNATADQSATGNFGLTGAGIAHTGPVTPAGATTTGLTFTTSGATTPKTSVCTAVFAPAAAGGTPDQYIIIS